MWKRNDIEDGKSYRVGLKADEQGNRSFHLLHANQETHGFDFVTPIIKDTELMKSRCYEKIIEKYGIEGDTLIKVDAHETWLTEQEAEQLFDISNHQAFVSYKDARPRFAPK